MPPTRQSAPVSPAASPAAELDPPRGPAPAPGAPPPPLPATVLSIVVDAVAEALATRGVTASVAHVLEADPPSCPVGECLPLGPLLAVDPALVVGHLHRAPTGDHVSSGADDGPATDLAVLGDLVAAFVARDLLDLRLAQREHQVAHLQIALESNRAIGVAVGVLMATRRCTATQAFDALREASQTQNRKLRDIAVEVQYTGALPTRTRMAG